MISCCVSFFLAWRESIQCFVFFVNAFFFISCRKIIKINQILQLRDNGCWTWIDYCWNSGRYQVVFQHHYFSFSSRNHITILGESASVTFDTLSRKKFPPEIYDNEELTPKTEEVRMPFNVIKKVPNGIGKVSRLRNLELQGNDIKKIPKSVGKLKNLR